MKRFFVVIFGVVFIFLAALVFAPSFIDWGAYKDQAEQQFADKTGLEIDIKGGVGFSVLPSPRFFVEDVSITSPKESENTEVVTLERLDVNVALMPLFSSQINVESLSVVKPSVSLEMLESGKLNIMTDEIEQLLSHNNKVNNKPKSSAPQISLDKIRIKDGKFNYRDKKSRENIAIQNINLDLSAQSLLGPFKAQGSLFYDGNALNFDIKTNIYDSKSKVITPKVKLILQPSNTALQYDGILSFENGISLQGQTGLKIDDAVEVLGKYNIKSLPFKSGSIEVRGILTADSKSVSYKNLSIKYNGQTISGEGTAKFSPLSYKVKVRSSKDFDISRILQDGYSFKNIGFDIVAQGGANKISLDKFNIVLDGQEATVKGKYIGATKSKRAKLDLNLKSQTLNYDKLASHLPKSSSAKDNNLKNSISAMALPFDLGADLNIGEFIYQGKSVKSIDAKLKIAGNYMALEKFKVKDFGGAFIKISGDMKDIKNVSGITSYMDLSTNNVTKLAKFFDFDTSSWPKKLKKANIKVKASGAFDVMNITTNISAMDGEVIAKGDIKTPLLSPELSDLILQVKHKNMAQAIRILTSANIRDKNLSKPLDLYSKVSQIGAKYVLKDIKGNLSGASVTGQIEADMGSSIPEIKGKLDFGRIKLKSVMGSSSKSSKNKSSVRWSKETIDTTSLHAANIDLALSAQHITYGAWPLNKPKMRLTLKNGTLNIIDLSSGVFGGNMVLSSQVKTSKEARSPIYFESSSEFNNVDIGKLSKALVGAQMVKVSGKSNLNLNIKSSGVSPAALIYDLSGTGVVGGSDIVLDGVDVTRFVRALSDNSKPGDTIMGLWKGSTKGGQTEFETLDGAFVIKNGVVKINSMTLDGVKARIETVGTVDLPKWYLSTKHKMIIKGTDEVPSDVPPFEMSFKGPLDNPTQTFAKGLLNDYLGRKIQRKLNSLISKKLGLPSNDNNAPKQEPASGGNVAQESQNNVQQDSQHKVEEQPNIEDEAEKAIKGLLQNLLR